MKPRHILYIIWIVIASLGVLCMLVPNAGIQIGGWSLRWPTMAKVLELDGGGGGLSYTDSSWLANEEDYALAIDTTEVYVSRKRVLVPLQPKAEMYDSILRSIADSLAQVAKEPREKVAKEKPKEVVEKSQVSREADEIVREERRGSSSASMLGVDSRRYLSAFYEALDSADVMPIRVVHYGDSQIEEDRITNILREHWQASYGGGGVGLIPLHQTIPTRSIRQWLSMNGARQSSRGGPMRYMIYGPRSRRQQSKDYGVMGHVAVMDDALVEGSEELVLHIEPMGKKRIAHQQFSRVRLLASEVDGEVVCHDTLLGIHPNGVTQLLGMTDRCQIALHGRGKVYGVSLETPSGVMVDNVPMRGCSGVIFTRINSSSFSNYFSATNTRLIILQYGGNMIPQSHKQSTIDGYIKNLRTQIGYLRSCAPYASILFIGPSDMSTRIEGELVTYPLVPYLDKQLKKMAAEEQIGYWSMYDAMGGRNSMVEWVGKGLAGSDYVHFTRAGANKVGGMLVKWIDEGKE